VIMEGILYSDIYAAMLMQLLADHRGINRCYRYQLDFDETVRRHATKPQASEYGPDTMRDWWRESDPLPGVTELTIGADASPAEATARIVRDCRWEAGA